MIGTMINNFDELENPTLKDFNEMFGKSVRGAENAPVKIGSMAVGGLRNVLIGDEKQRIELTAYKPRESVKYLIHVVRYKGEMFFSFSSRQAIADVLGSSKETIWRYCTEGLSYYGYTFETREVSKEVLDEVASYKLPEKVVLDKDKRRQYGISTGRPCLYNYLVKIEVTGESRLFTSQRVASEFAGVHRTTLESRLNSKFNGKMLRGWAVTKIPKES